MPLSEDEPISRWSWRDWWFAPRWRALLTWVGLALVARGLNQEGIRKSMGEVLDFLPQKMQAILHVPWPREIDYFVFFGNIALLACWFEPIVLRLNLRRALIWIVLRCVPFAVTTAFFEDHNQVLEIIAIVVCSALAVPLLQRWRSRPWMSIIGGMLMAGAAYYFPMRNLSFQPWMWNPASSLPYAFVLLYGTRLLTPVEREKAKGEL